MIELGSKVQCLVTGFTGVAIGRHEYLYGCTRYSVLPKTKKEAKGTLEPERYFDEPQLKVLAKPTKIIKDTRTKAVAKNPGGPMISTPQRNSAPKR